MELVSEMAMARLRSPVCLLLCGKSTAVPVVVSGAITSKISKLISLKMIAAAEAYPAAT